MSFEVEFQQPQIHFVIRRVKKIEGRGIFGYSFCHPVSYKLSYYSSELFIRIVGFFRNTIPAVQQVSVAQEVSVMDPKGEPPFKMGTTIQHFSLISRLSPSPNTILMSWTCTKWFTFLFRGDCICPAHAFSLSQPQWQRSKEPLV